MEAKDIKSIHKAINDNIEAIKSLFDSAKVMQNSIPQLTNDEDRETMKTQFKSVAEAINRLMESTTRLFELLESAEGDQQMNKDPQRITEGGQNDSLHMLSDDAFQKLQKQANTKTKRTKDDWRSLFVLIILSGHFLLIGAIVLTQISGRDVDSVIKILSAVGSLLGSSLGFVIGYYYKDRSKQCWRRVGEK